jgi:hypothetical protein
MKKTKMDYTKPIAWAVIAIGTIAFWYGIYKLVNLIL